MTKKENNMVNDIKNELSTNFIEYAVAVNSDRAIPDAKSGLKPVAKRILWSAFEEGRTSSKPHVKSARIVGDVMGKYHPHGDSSIYGAMVRLSQDWVMRYPLIDWHGSNGNQSGDGPAAARYTEARLSKISEQGMLQNIKKKNVYFISNYDETLDEPITLPALFPNLLCNPNAGIGVAIACSWAPHNLTEVTQAIVDYIDGKEPMLPGPDFPTGGIIINKNDIPNIMRTGHGSVKIRGRYNIEKNKIIFYEIPYGETIEGILGKIGEACETKEIEGIIDAHDESNKKGIRIVITCDKNISPEAIVQKLFSKTPLQSSFSYNQVALIDKTPTELNLKQCIEIYINHNVDCLIKETCFDIATAEKRKEVVDGLLKALANINDIIALIKSSDNSTVAKERLIKTYQFTELQAKSILAMKLSSLSKLEGIELNKEKAELEKNLENWYDIVNNKEKQINIIKNRLETLTKKFGDKRKTDLVQLDIKPEEKEIAEVIPVDVVVVTSQSGLIKKIPVASFRTQRRGGKGIKSMDNAILSAIKTNTVDYIMFFTNKGKMYRIIADNIPDGTNAGKGVPINSLVTLAPDEKVIAVTSLHRKTLPKYAIFITKQGMFKKTFLAEYMATKRNAGIAAMKMRDGDCVVNIIFQDDEDVVIITKNGMNIRFKTDSVAPISRVAMGVKGIKLNDDDEVIAALPVHKETDTLGIFSTGGYGKKVALKEILPQGRGGKGNVIYKPTTGEYIAGAAMLSDEDKVLLNGNTSTICISATEIPLLSKSAQGNILIKNNRVSSVTKI